MVFRINKQSIFIDFALHARFYAILFYCVLHNTYLLSEQKCLVSGIIICFPFFRGKWGYFGQKPEAEKV